MRPFVFSGGANASGGSPKFVRDARTQIRRFATGRRLASLPLILFIASALTLGLALPASADTVTIAGSMEGNLAVNPGDTINAGYAFSMPGTHPGATVTVAGGIVQMNVICSDGSAQTLTIALPTQIYTVGANDNSWYPSSDQSSLLSYQGSTMAPPTLCGGRPGHAPNGATFTGIMASTDDSDPIDARFHYRDNSNGSWSETVHCHRRGGPGPSSTIPVFGREVIVDHQRINGEPVISIDPTDRIYVSGPFGSSTTASYVWRSTDHGQSFHLTPGNLAPYGKPLVTCIGGGDSALAIDSVDRLYFADLQTLTEVSNSVSSDEGTTWLSTCTASHDTDVDRPWIAAFGDPQNGGTLYQTVDQVNQCTTGCGLGQVGNNIVEITWSQGTAAGTLFSPAVPQQIEPDGIVSGIVTDAHGGVYIAHTGLVDQFGHLGGSDGNSNVNAVVVVRFPNGYNQTTPTPLTGGQTLCQISPSTCTTSVVYKAPLSPANCDITSVSNLTTSCASTVTVGQDFSPIAIDRAGNLYVVWSQAPVDTSTGKINGASQIFMSVSTNHGATWGPPVQVTAATPTLQTNLFPWIAAGDPGRVDIVWYGTPTLGSCPNQPCGSSAITAHWIVMMAQSLNAIKNGAPNPSPSFTTAQVSEVSNHFGAVCTMGIGCTTGGDRGLLDFLSVTVGLKGEANVVWADAVNRNQVMGTSSALIAFSRQVAGPSLYAKIGQVTGPAPAKTSAAGSPDAFYSADGSATLATGNLLIQSASVTMPDAQHYQFKINVSDLGTLCVPITLGGTGAVWLVRWEVPDPNGPGHTYFAAMEADAVLGSPACIPPPTVTFYDGETLSVDTTHGKFLTYNPAHTIQGNYTASGTGGVITLNVPVADVGGNPSATLVSVTALTATLVPTSQLNSDIITATSTSTGPLFNQIDATGPFDFVP